MTAMSPHNSSEKNNGQPNNARMAAINYFKEKLPYFIQLARLDKPIGILLLLWPTLWALWIAAQGFPQLHLLIIFVLGVVLMRTAGCIVNDYADRNLDGQVERTRNRPLATGKVSSKEALIFAVMTTSLAFVLVLFTNFFTILLSFGAVVLAAIYPFMKRYTYLPQVVLGATFAWSIPMAFAAQTNSLSKAVWLLYASTLLWIVAYDTIYAMVDREDDIKAGIKSTAILFGDADKIIIGLLQVAALIPLLLLGHQLQLSFWFYLGLLAAAGLFLYQQYLIKDRDKEQCFKAFLNNNWVGIVIFLGIVLHYFFI